MKAAAVGVRMHSGWGVTVTMSGRHGAVELLDRREIVVADDAVEGSKQPYHFAAELNREDAHAHLAKCAKSSSRLALNAFKQLIEDMRSRDISVVGGAILEASGRPLPALDVVLKSHSLIHAAEGEFYRMVVREAFARLGSPWVGLRERELKAEAARAFVAATSSLLQELGQLGKIHGPPWKQDHKTCAAAAMILLAAPSLFSERRAK